MTTKARTDLLAMYRSALARVNGRTAVREALRASPPTGPVALVALGKAAQAMAEGARESLRSGIRSGLLISKPGHLDWDWLGRTGLQGIEGGHPMPDDSSLLAGERLLRFLAALPRDETLLFLLSGGASSLAEHPLGGISVHDLRRINGWLLASGFSIEQMNQVRKTVSAIKAGGLLHRLAGRSVRALLISDVPGDDPGVIGSGPLVPDPTLAEKIAALDLPAWLRRLVEHGLAERADASGADDVELRLEIVATLRDAMAAAGHQARALGYGICTHPEFQSGEAEATGRELAKTLLCAPGRLHVWGGESTVQLPETPGRGGRNQHLALAAAAELAGRRGCYLLAAGTDGTDGPTEDAGALVDGGTLERAALQGFQVERALREFDSGSLLEASGDLIHTGPTGTNVMDLTLGLCSDLGEE